MQTVWVFGDQLNRKIGALADAKPATHRVLMIESRAKITTRRWHVQRAHFIVASMRRFAAELREAGFEVVDLGVGAGPLGVLREAHARAFGGFDMTAFAAVDRAEDDPRRPADHHDNEVFWHKRGYVRQPGMTMLLRWDERDVGDVAHPMTFWTRPLEASA